MRWRSAALVASLAATAALSVAACTDDKPPPASDDTQGGGPAAGFGTVAEGGARGDAASDADGGSCTDLIAPATDVDQEGVVGDPPAGLQGALVDGTYALTQAQRYVGSTGTGGPTGFTYEGAIRITTAGTVIERVTRVRNTTGGSSTQNAAKGTYVITGANFSLAFACPNAVTETSSYSVVGETIVLTNLQTKEAFTYTHE